MITELRSRGRKRHRGLPAYNLDEKVSVGKWREGIKVEKYKDTI